MKCQTRALNSQHPRRSLVGEGGGALMYSDQKIRKSENASMTSEEGERGYNFKFLKKNRSTYFFLKKIIPNS